MKKLISVAAFLAASTALANASVTLHDTTFDVELTSPIQNVTSIGTSNCYIPVDTTVYGNTTSAGGLYINAGSGLKINNKSTFTVTYLYIDGSVLVQSSPGSEAVTANQINWSDGNGKFSITSTTGAWVDINANYSSYISLSNMASGSVYLNTVGALTSTLANSNTVYATALMDLATITSASAYSYDETTQTVTRTLLSGDFSSGTWNSSNVVLSGVSNYTVSATASGLTVSYSIPEPSAFGLLAGVGALALVAARRRLRAK